MKINCLISKTFCKKIAMMLLLAASAVGAFATLGDGNAKKGKSTKTLLSIKSPVKPGLFTLQSGYNFRGSQVINTKEEKYINLNTFASFQQGQTTYVMPLKKKVALNGKITFNPNAATR
jgi:hypothetical protein